MLITWAWPIWAAEISTTDHLQADTANTSPIPIWQGYILPPTIVTYEPLNLNPTNFDPYSCISFVKAVLGISGTLGNAWDLEPNSDKPSVGAIILLQEGKGHAAVVVDFDSETITIKEANYLPGQVTVRTLPRNHDQIRGYKVINSDI